MEGLLSTGPTPSSLYTYLHEHNLMHNVDILSLDYFQRLLRISEITYYAKISRSQEKLFMGSVIACFFVVDFVVILFFYKLYTHWGL